MSTLYPCAMAMEAILVGLDFVATPVGIRRFGDSSPEKSHGVMDGIDWRITGGDVEELKFRAGQSIGNHCWILHAPRFE